MAAKTMVVKVSQWKALEKRSEMAMKAFEKLVEEIGKCDLPKVTAKAAKATLALEALFETAAEMSPDEPQAMA